MKLGSGECVIVDGHNLRAMKDICLLLENAELYGHVVDFELEGTEIDSGNAISRLLMKEELGLDSSPEISFLASHFYEIDISSVVSVGVSDLERVLCDSDLKLKDENSLVDLLVQLCDEDSEYYCLFRYVSLQYVDISH